MLFDDGLKMAIIHCILDTCGETDWCNLKETYLQALKRDEFKDKI